ncbi:exonuclease domain-containing protein [Paraburkholderia pallida]|uniref:DNA polymerase III subunit epsilon n=1 Tax=Paraburkholderia pallida TaxID=2547399 RepID=A0A4P7D232_9BURK|nr:exonuclease domain-containing protein [Paraburkholderia pallida]QBR00484.1 DNA polymerase III subunit epsilon [Paraburkholderia pallida]
METPQSAESSKPRSSGTKAPFETAILGIVDTETTGLGPNDEPISLGIALFEVDLPKGGLVRELDTYYGLREPSVQIGAGALAVHGITAEQVAGKQFDGSRVTALLERADILIAHNAEFDFRMLAHIIPQVRSKPWRCSYRQIWWSDHLPVPNRKLDTICEHLGIERPNPHNALDDCRALAAALFTRTGKTARSRTFFGVALSKGDFPLVVPARQTAPDASRVQASEREFPTYAPPPTSSIHDNLVRGFVYLLFIIFCLAVYNAVMN